MIQAKQVNALLKARYRREMGWSILFVAPAILGFLLFVITPLARTVFMSLTNWSGYSDQWDFVGVSNYAQVLGQPRFYRAIGRSLIFMAYHIVLGAGGGLIIAFLISQARWFQNLFRVLLFFPRVLALSVVGITWTQLCHPIIGLFNTTLEAIGLGALTTAWLGDTATALPMVSIASTWNAYGFYMVIFLSAMQSIDPSLYEAARIDGASKRQQFVHVTIPGLYNTISTVLVMGFIAGIKGFGTVWSMTQGGPVDATELAMVYIWRGAFQNNQMPYALAGSIVFGLVIMGVSVAMNQLRERKDIDA